MVSQYWLYPKAKQKPDPTATLLPYPKTLLLKVLSIDRLTRIKAYEYAGIQNQSQ